MNIYIRKEGRRDGPFSPKQAGEFIRQGRYSLSDLAWHEGMHEWSPIHALPDVVTFVLPPIPVKKQVLSPALPTAEQIPDIPASAQSPIIMPPIFHKTSGWPLFFVVCIIGFFGGVAGAMLSDSTGNEWGSGFIAGAALSVLIAIVINRKKVVALFQKNEDGQPETAKELQPKSSLKPLVSEQSKSSPELTDAATVKCPYCGAQYPVGTIKCTHDNTTLSTDPSAGNWMLANVGNNIMKIMAFGTILLLLLWFFSTNDGSQNRSSMMLMRFMTTILSRGHFHE